jgi:hypothetical protein
VPADPRPAAVDVSAGAPGWERRPVFAVRW